MLDELVSDDDVEASNQPSKEDDHIDVENHIHDRPPPAGGLDVLSVTTPTPSIKI